MPDEKQNLREILAANAHDSWSRWMQHLFSKSESRPDGSVRIPEELVQRWRRQSQTEYTHLSWQEKQSDIREADRVLALLTPNSIRVKPGVDDENGI